MISKIKEFLAKNKKSMYFTALFLIVFIFSYDLGFAAEEGEKYGVNIVNVVYLILSAILGLVNQLVGVFLTPSWSTGTALGLATKLKDLWILVSNVVYFIFAFLLIWIAFMNIIGKEGDTFALKTALPKFVVGVLIVPFSWFIVQFVISISSVLTVSVLSMPFDTFTSSFTNSEKEIIAQNCTLTLGKDSLKKAFEKHDSKNVDNVIKEFNESYKCSEKTSIKNLLSGEGIYQIITIYSYGIMKIDKFDTITSSDLGFVENILQLGIHGIFNLLFFIVYFLLMISLLLALFVRGIYLWLFMIFSPVFGLLYFFGSDKAGELGKKFKFSEFISLAMVPVYVSAALSFGLLFIFVAADGVKTGGDGTIEIINDGNTLKFLDSKYTVVGGVLGSTSNKAGELLDIAGGSLGAMFIDLIALVVLWLGVMAALRHSTITGDIVKPISEFGGSIGGLAMKLPQYAPIIPGVGGVDALGKAGGLIQSQASNIGNKQLQKHGIDTGINKMFGSDIDIQKETRLKEIYGSGIDQNEVKEAQKTLKDLINKRGFNNPRTKDFMKQFAESLEKGILQGKGLDKIDFSNLNDNDTAKAVNAILNFSNKSDYSAYENFAHGKDYIKSHMMPGGKDEINKEGDKGLSESEQSKVTNEGKVIVGTTVELKAFVDKGTGDVIASDKNGKSSAMKFDNYSSLIDSKISTLDELIGKMGNSDKVAFKEMIKSLDLSDDDSILFIKHIFNNIKSDDEIEESIKKFMK